MLGPNIFELLEFCDNTFSINQVTHIGIEILELLLKLHKTGHAHNDVKIDNFVISLNNND